MKAELGLSHRAFGFLATAFFLVYLCTSPVFGYLGDRWGRIRLMAGGAVLWSLATSLTFWVGSYPALLLARGAVGVGEGSFGTLLAGLPGGHPAPGAPGPGPGLVLPGHAGGLGPGLPGGRLGGQPLGLAPGLSVGRIAGPGHGRPGLSPARGPAPGPSHLCRPSGRALDGILGLLNIPTLRWVTLGYAMVTFTLGGLAIWMPTYLQEFKGLSLLQANLLLFGSVALAGAWGP